MIATLAALYWLILAITQDPSAQSRIKGSYPELQFIEIARERFLGSLTGVSDEANGLVAGLTIGVRDMVTDELALAMRDLSLTHLVAVSGANLAIVMGVVYLITAALGLNRNLRFGLAFAIMALYVVLVGPESSVIRAAVMAIFVGVGIWLGRGTAPIHGLALAILILLAVDPALAVDLGFALSALATAGLLILAPEFYERLKPRFPMWLAATIAATVAAQLYTLPVLLMLQPSLPVYSVLANLLVEPTVAPITILGITAVVLASLIPPLAPAVAFLASIPAQWIVLVSMNLAALPMTRLHFVPGAVGIALTVSLTLLLTLRLLARYSRFHRALSFSLALLVAATIGWVGQDMRRQQMFAGDWEVLACDVGQGDAVLVRSAGRIALIDVGKNEAELTRCLEQAGVKAIDLLFLTHFDLDHVGAIAALTPVQISRAFISGFSDDRPVVELVEKVLHQKSVPLEIGYAGLGGALGSASWQILSPSHAAKEAQDSNDASLVTLFRFEDFALLGLGDLGASAQQRLLGANSGLLAQLSGQQLILKVAHHGSADQDEKLMKTVKPDIAVFSVGRNDYGHPTRRALDLATSSGALVLRTDQSGSIAFGSSGEQLGFRLAGKLTA